MEGSEAAKKIQRFWKHTNVRNQYSRSVCNWNDSDPISLETIKDLPLSRIFFTIGHKGKLMGYDCIPWLKYFAMNCNRKHPANKVMMTPDDIWQCYLTALRILPNWNETICKYHATSIVAKKKSNTYVEFYPTSPLVNLSFRKMNTETLGPKQKRVHINYQLLDKRNFKPMTKILTTSIDLPLHVNVMFSA